MTLPFVKPYEAFLAIRFLLGKKHTSYVSFTSWASIIAMQLAVMTLIVVLSVMNGFREIIEHIYVSVDAEIQVTGDEFLPHNWPQIEALLQRQAGVLHLAPYFDKQGLVLNGQSATPLQIRGMLPDQEARIVKLRRSSPDNVLATLTPGSNHVVVGIDLARGYELSIGSKLSVIVPKSGKTLESPDIKTFEVSGVFATSDNKSNDSLVYVHLADLQNFVGVGPTVQTGYHVAIANMDQAPSIANGLRQVLPKDLRVIDWQQKNATQYKAIKLEKLVMTVMLSIIILISGLNIVTTTVMTVNAKKGEIAILMTMGSQAISITRIFILIGFILGICGVVFGVGSGMLIAPNIGNILAQLESWFSFHVFDPAALDIPHIPSKMEAGDVILVASLAFVTSIVSTIYPALRAARTDPAQALRYE